MRLGREPLAVRMGAHPHDLEARHGLVGQGVGDGLGEGREVVRRVVVDEQDLVVGVRQEFCDGVQADGGPLVQVVAMAVVAAVKYH